MGTFTEIKTIIEFVVFAGLLVFGIGKWVKSREEQDQEAVKDVADLAKELGTLRVDQEAAQRRLRQEIDGRVVEQACGDRRHALQGQIDALQAHFAKCQADEEHRVRSVLNAAVPALLGAYARADVMDVRLKAIDDRLIRMETAAEANQGQTNVRLSSIEAHLRAIRANGKVAKTVEE